MANIVQNTICKMLRNLKDGQVYVSVDEVHQYLKKTGNVITKEKMYDYKPTVKEFKKQIETTNEIQPLALHYIDSNTRIKENL